MPAALKPSEETQPSPATYEEAAANAEPGDTIATTKEEEWVTRKKSEVTTRRQIATRVKRELVLEDGRVLKDSGPKISTSVDEDTHTTNVQQSEHRVPDDEKKNEKDEQSIEIDKDAAIAKPVRATVRSRVVANPDGKVRESRERTVRTRDVLQTLLDTEESVHRGDTTHQALIAAINTPKEDIREALAQETEKQVALESNGPRVLRDTTAHSTTIDTDDTKELRALRPDGTVVVETRHTKEQERICDEELSEDEAKSLASDQSFAEEKRGKERRRRVDEVVSTDVMAGGRRVATHVRTVARTEEAEKDGHINMDEDWDSLSVRMRRQRRLRLNDHDKDAKRPPDFDIEEETRKKETSKWLESHFGSDSRSSHDSIAEEIERRPEPKLHKYRTREDEGYYGKKSVQPAHDRPLRKTKSSTPVNREDKKAGGYYKGVVDWSQRYSSEDRMPEARSSSPSPPVVRSHVSHEKSDVNRRRVKGDSPQARLSPIARRNPPSREDSAYISSSTMHSPPRGSPFRPLEMDRSFREPSIEEDYAPVAPERKRSAKNRSSEENRYDSGYRSSSRNENSGRSRDSRDESGLEPPPDYSPPRGRRNPDKDRKQNQKTRFADSARQASPARRSVSSAIGNSIRKLVGKIRSASSERKGRRRESRTPSPRRGETVPLPAAPTHRYYLGEDPFAPSIYGREHKYESSVRRTQTTDGREHKERERVQFASTLGRYSQSTSRLNPNSEAEEEHIRNTQTLPRKLHDRKDRPEKPSSNKYWHKLTPGRRPPNLINEASSSSEAKANGYSTGPPKPARAYKALNRSKSFAMGVPEHQTHPRYVSGMSRHHSTMYKSNPHLARLDETPEQLKSPGIVSIINRSQRDLADAVSRETERRRDGLFGARYGKILSNGHTNGHVKSYDETDKKKIFLKGLRDRAPELYQSLHEDESESSRISSRYGTPSSHRASEERKIPIYRTDTSIREASPFLSRMESRHKSPVLRRGSNSSDNYSETYRYTTRSGDPEHPSITDTVEKVTKKVVPSKDGRCKEVIESREVNSVTKSRGYRDEPFVNGKYLEKRTSPLTYETKPVSLPLYSERRSKNYRVFEKVRNY